MYGPLPITTLLYLTDLWVPFWEKSPLPVVFISSALMTHSPQWKFLRPYQLYAVNTRTCTHMCRFQEFCNIKNQDSKSNWRIKCGAFYGQTAFLGRVLYFEGAKMRFISEGWFIMGSVGEFHNGRTKIISKRRRRAFDHIFSAHFEPSLKKYSNPIFYNCTFLILKYEYSLLERTQRVISKL